MDLGEGKEQRSEGNFILKRLIICMYHIKEKGQGMSYFWANVHPKFLVSLKLRGLLKRCEHKSKDNINMDLTRSYNNGL
jgi:hypothetical protein